MPQPFEDGAEALAGGSDHGVDAVSLSAHDEVAAEMAVGLEVPDDRLDSESAPEFAFDDTVHAAFLAGDEDPARPGRAVAALAFVDIGALDLDAGEGLDFRRHGALCDRRRGCRGRPWRGARTGRRGRGDWWS